MGLPGMLIMTVYSFDMTYNYNRVSVIIAEALNHNNGRELENKI